MTIGPAPSPSKKPDGDDADELVEESKEEKTADLEREREKR
jgi:hypothetical protein